jgi:predicted PurR-regulated permease PerM
MADVARTPSAQVRISLRAALAVVFALAATVLVLEIAHGAQRVIAWVLCAMVIAALVYPLVAWLAHFRYVPRPVAVLLTVLLMLGSIGFVSYRIVHDVSDAMGSLQQAAPARAAQLERSSDFFREIKLRERVQKLVDAIPRRLAGGEATQVLKSALTRTVAFLAGLILTIFFILYGIPLFEGALAQIRNLQTRARVESVARNGSRRALFYARVKLWEALVEGLLAYSIARIADVPGPAALGIWVALWSLLPVAGVLIGALPIVVFAGAHSIERAIVVALCFVVIGIADALVNRWLERRSVNPGSFVIVLAAFGGLELYGLTGALLGVFFAILAAALASEVGLEEMSGVFTTSPASS